MVRRPRRRNRRHRPPADDGQATADARAGEDTPPHDVPRHGVPAVGEALRRAVEVPHAISLHASERLRADNPGATPAQLVEVATRRFIRHVGVESGAVGTAAAYPGAGTAVSVVASGAQLVSFVSEAAHYTLVVAHLHGIDLRDPAKRTALVLSVLTGRRGAETITSQLGIQTLAWFRHSFIDIRTTSAKQFNLLMAAWLRRTLVRDATTSTLGRLIPFGVGAVVGWRIGRSMAISVVEGVEIALGTPPLQDPRRPVVVDVRVEDVDDRHGAAFEALQLPGAPRTGRSTGDGVGVGHGHGHAHGASDGGDGGGGHGHGRANSDSDGHGHGHGHGQAHGVGAGDSDGHASPDAAPFTTERADT